MKKCYMLFMALAICAEAFAQHTLSLVIKDSKTLEPLIGATAVLSSLSKSSATDTEGLVTFTDIPTGLYTIEYRYLGYLTRQDTITVPQGTRVALLEADSGAELDEVRVTTTRSTRTISNIPTRIEVIAGEELDEKGNMKAGDIRMILNESTGIQTQQTSATSANASIRIQGLDGRYTQILKDGFPLFAGAASGLSLLQTPPLDLKQVEVIKGSASTLYGGGAIAGLVNLISKRPGEERDFQIHLNGTSAGGLDLNAFYSENFGRAGVTIFAARNSNAAYAPSGIDFTAIPEFRRYTFNPKLFLRLNDKTSLDIGLNSSFENRTGGDLHYIEGSGDADHSFFENNRTRRLSSQIYLKHILSKDNELTFKNSVSSFNRRIVVPGYVFEGQQYGTFTEVSFNTSKERSEWVTGLNIWTDLFNEAKKASVPVLDYNQATFGGFIQNNIHVKDWMELETGLRADYVKSYGFALLPRFSALFKVNGSLNSRIGGGLGYKAPTVFTEESERIQYRGVLPISSEVNQLERSYGVNWDINYRTLLSDKLMLSINHLFFYTFLNNPLLLEPAGITQSRFTNLRGHIDTRGMETNMKLTYNDLKLFVGYSFTDAKIHTNNVRIANPLTARHRLNNVLMYEVQEKWKFGAEGYYYSKQQLNDGLTGKSYWLFGFMTEKLWDNFSIYINFENFTDTRQTRFDSIYTGSSSNPIFRDIYAPLDGFVVNAGIKLKL